MTPVPTIQQAKKPDSQPQFLQIVAKRVVRAKSEPKLTRVAFAVSRLMEFCTETELQNQTGHSVREWPIEKVVPDEDLLAATYRAFHRSERLRARFEEMEQQFDKEAVEVDVPKDLEDRVRAVLAECTDLRWDHAVQCVLDPTQLSRVRAEKGRAERKSGDFTSEL